MMHARILLTALFALFLLSVGCTQPKSKSDDEPDKNPDSAGETEPGEPSTGSAGDAAAPSTAQTTAEDDDAQPVPEGTDDGDTATPSEIPSGEARAEVVVVDGSEVRPFKDGTLEYCLDCVRKSPTFQYCYFEPTNFEAMVGADYKDKTLTLRVEMLAKGTRNLTPDDPDAPQPEGGFTQNDYDCTVLDVISDK